MHHAYAPTPMPTHMYYHRRSRITIMMRCIYIMLHRYVVTIICHVVRYCLTFLPHYLFTVTRGVSV